MDKPDDDLTPAHPLVAFCRGDESRARRLRDAARTASRSVEDRQLSRLLSEVADGRANPRDLARSDAFGALVTRRLESSLEARETDTDEQTEATRHLASAQIEETYGADLAEARRLAARATQS